MSFIRDAAVCDNKYMVIIEVKTKNLTKAEVKMLPQDHPCRVVVPVWDHLGLLNDGMLLTYDVNRIIISRGARRELIQITHLAHMGVVCTYQAL